MRRKFAVVLTILIVILISSAYGRETITPVDLARTHVRRGEFEKALGILKTHLKNNPEDADAYYLKFIAHSKLDQDNDAQLCLENAAMFDPDNSKYDLARGNYYFQLGKNEKALGFYNDLIETGKSNPFIYRQISRIYLRQSDYKKALMPLNKAVESEPDNYLNFKLLAQNNYDLGDNKKAVRNYKKALDLIQKDKKRTSEFFSDPEYSEPVAELKKEKLDILYALGNIYEDSNDTESAIEIYKKITATYPDERNASMKLSRLYRKKGETWLSIKSWFDFTFKGGPMMEAMSFFAMLAPFILIFVFASKIVNSILIFPLALLFGGLRKVAWLEKLSHFASIYAIDYMVFLCNYEITLIDPDNIGAWNRIGIYYERSKKLDLAVKSYKKALSLNDSKADIWFSLGVVQHKRKDYKESELALKRALQINEENYMYWYYLSLSYYEQDMFKESADSAHKSLDLSYDFTPSLDVFVEACELSGQLDSCKEVLKKLISKKPGFLKLLMEMGSILLSSGEPIESLQYFRKATEISPESYETWYNLGLAQREMDMLERAAESIHKAIELSPNSSWIHTSFGLTKYKNSDEKAAVKVLNHALKLDPLSSYSHYLLGMILKESEPAKSVEHMKLASKHFESEIDGLTKPWQRANEYECIAIAHEFSGSREKAKEALLNAVKYAKITPAGMYIFSETKMKLTQPEEFIKECSGRIKKVSLKEENKEQMDV